MNIIDKINNKEAVVGILGLGYVGLPLALTCVRQGFSVIGFDYDLKKILSIEDKKSYIKHVKDKDIDKAVSSGLLQATNKFKRIDECDVVIICVPTPLNKNREPDMSCVENAVFDVSYNLPEHSLLILESTTYPGTTDELVVNIMTTCGFSVGRNYYLAFSPEREDPGNKNFNTQTTPKVVGGVTPKCLEIATLFYSKILDKVVPVSSARVAEMTKLLENIFRSVNIALVNEMKMVADLMDIDIWEVIDAAATKPFGFMPFYPGPGLGGHCIPVDPFYLSWKAKEFNMTTRFIELAGEINTGMHHYVINKVINALNDKKKSVNGSKVLVCGVSYKSDIDDMRESPSIEIIKMLQEKNADIHYLDSYVDRITVSDIMYHSLKESDIKKDAFDACLIVTKHSNVDYQNIINAINCVVDCRHATRGLDLSNCSVYYA